MSDQVDGAPSDATTAASATPALDPPAATAEAGTTPAATAGSGTTPALDPSAATAGSGTTPAATAGSGTTPGTATAPTRTPAAPVPVGGEADVRTAEAAIRIQHLAKRYGDLFAVNDLTLDIPRGSVFGLIGPNGAGKTTTFSVLATLLRPTGGWVTVAGLDPVRQPRDVRRVLGYMPDAMGVYDGLRVVEYLEFFAASYKVPRARWQSTLDTLLELVDLGGKRDAMVNSLSRGMKQRLSLARALVHDPEVLVLDEPASGLDPRARVELRNLLVELRTMGKTIVVSSHILAELTEMCTAVAIMEKGRLLASGTPAEIRERSGAGRQVRVRLAGGEERTVTVADEAEQQALLRSLIEEGEAVIEFTEVGHGLEDLFMSITTGEVQ